MNSLYRKFAKSHFPAHWKDYKKYIKIIFPIVISAFLFSMNNFIDNFMVAQISGGVTALSVANTWTAILTASFYGTSYIAATAFSQFYGKRDYHNSINLIKFRLTIMSTFALLLAILAISIPQQLIYLLLPSATETVLNQAVAYIRIIAPAWLVMAWTTSFALLLRETKLGKLQLFITIVQIIVNVTANAIFLFVLHFDASGAAIGTFISQAVGFIGFFGIHFYKNKKLRFLPHKIFAIDKKIWKLMLKRSPGGITAFLALFAIFFRNVIWNYNYPSGSIGPAQFALSASAILGITGAINSVFLSTLDSVSSAAGIFVGWNLGKNDEDKARVEANRLKLFNFLFGLSLTPLIILLIILMPYFSFLAQGEANGELAKSGSTIGNILITDEIALENSKQITSVILRNIQLTLIPLVFTLPIWMWIFSSIASISLGHKNAWLGTLDALVNLIALGAIPLIVLIFPSHELWKNYSLFILVEVMISITYEFFYYKIKWNSNITNV
ncbi:Na+-driven multidrug efflux pump [Mycoplasma testudineum]|uniref:Probable multidrug resistance protein NorM n=1 Tax=Mycoplasma testudineum TaxID=244584 RepID=A0A4V3C337_9MOLU|nr:MATE family efflux transporter [Mycoplasma testudineum]OYD26911.1 hypothetical protein CG473_01045 [Mycoplasma testudineum]TDO20459.1 Na+-driven multidrug efflux pump [Mycoplasma testudineum]